MLMLNYMIVTVYSSNSIAWICMSKSLYNIQSMIQNEHFWYLEMCIVNMLLASSIEKFILKKAVSYYYIGADVIDYSVVQHLSLMWTAVTMDIGF